MKLKKTVDGHTVLYDRGRQRCGVLVREINSVLWQPTGSNETMPEDDELESNHSTYQGLLHFARFMISDDQQYGGDMNERIRRNRRREVSQVRPCPPVVLSPGIVLSTTLPPGTRPAPAAEPSATGGTREAVGVADTEGTRKPDDGREKEEERRKRKKDKKEKKKKKKKDKKKKKKDKKKPPGPPDDDDDEGSGHGDDGPRRPRRKPSPPSSPSPSSSSSDDSSSSSSSSSSSDSSSSTAKKKTKKGKGDIMDFGKWPGPEWIEEWWLSVKEEVVIKSKMGPKQWNELPKWKSAY